MEHGAERQIPTGTSVSQIEDSGARNVGKRHNKSQISSKTNRNIEFRKLCNHQRKTKLSSITGTCQFSSKCPSTNQYLPVLESETRASLVAGELQFGINDTQPSALTLSDNRCQRCWMGGNVEWQEPTGHMVHCRTEPSLQPERNDCHFKSPGRSGTEPEFRRTDDSMRQQDSSIIPAQRGGNQITSTGQSGNKSFSYLGSVQHSYDHLPPTGKLQFRGRSLITSARTTRVASDPICYGDSIQKVGCTRNRSVCLSSSPRCSKLLHTRRVRLPSVASRCPGDNLELQDSVGISTTIPNTESAGSHEQSHRDLPLSSTPMGESVLEVGFEKQSAGTSVHCQKPIESLSGYINRPTTAQSDGADSRNLEMWGWDPYLSDWSDEQKALLSSSWRKSTLNTYRPAWRRWLDWATHNKINAISPNGSQLARYLADLHQKEGLSLKTIMVHKSAISTLCDPNNHSKLSSHTLVKQVLKSISIANPKQPNPPIWDIDVLVSYLNQRDADISNFYEASRHTAAVLLLCSGRRVHDLTLLKVSSEHFSQSDGTISLWPAYGSKTDTANRRQSGWKLMHNKDNKNLDPVYWVNHLIQLSQSRRSETTADHLFLSTFGKPKPATRTIISGWIKKLLREAGIEDTPGSIRSAVASKNWTENFQLDDILARGNWQSANTFRKFYCREIIPTVQNPSLITSCFEPVN